MKPSIDPSIVIQQLRRLQAVFKDEETSIAMRMTNRRDKCGVMSTIVGYEVKHERLESPILTKCPRRSVNLLMKKTNITGVEQYCRSFLNGGHV